MKVRATFKNADAKFGFYDSKVRYNGTEFELLKKSDFDPSWMVEDEDDKAVRKTKAKKSIEWDIKEDGSS